MLAFFQSLNTFYRNIPVLQPSKFVRKLAKTQLLLQLGPMPRLNASVVGSAFSLI